MELREIFLSNNIEVTDRQLQQFERYADLLIEWNEKFNLTSITGREDIYVKHFYDSILPSLYHDLKGSLVDVGSGAGFPGIPLKIMYPDLEVTLIEPTGKRCTFLNEVISQLSLDKITVVNMRSEDYARENVRFDFVTARAVAELNILTELCLPLVKTDGHFIVMKGPKAYQELENASRAIRVLGGTVREVREIPLSSDQTRVLIDIQKTSGHDPKYPRNYSQIKKKPL
ncbi:MAG: 16S rRNA (guanine(527)-N(7))-methyltransferase RsmG [Erysipelotrichaceae bacterium]|nr:16S rRNA (guanine(527)-N(7))-methyltransferase RsmG [Erysipelotrichaceae bacterium]MBQ1757294.1 16S rRNA (guanine(527)-N(7))-methyltransferase RsmG [Erysipelotrichaceae bacterium]